MKDEEEKVDATQLETDVKPVESSLKTNKDVFFENIQSKYPDLDEEGVYGHAMQKYDAKKGDIKRYEETTAMLEDAINAEPEAANLVKLLARYPNQLAFVLKSVFDKEFLQGIVDNYDEIDSDESKQKEFEDYKNSREERQKQKMANEQYIAEVSQNAEKSQQVIEEYAAANGYNVEDVNKTIVDEFITPVLSNNITPEFLEVIMKGKNFDKKVEEVANENYELGVIDAKNEKIEEIKLTKKEAGDGTIMPSSKGIDKSFKPKLPTILEGTETKNWWEKGKN